MTSKQTTTQKRKRVTNKGGQCLTDEAAMNLLGSEAAAKRQKLIDSPKKKNLVGFLALNRVSGAVSIVC